MRRLRLGVEFVALFWGVPALLWARPVHGPKILLLLVVAGVCLALLLRDGSFDRQRLWNSQSARAGLGRVVWVFMVTAPLLIAGVLCFRPGDWLGFVRRAPVLWAVVMALYPLLSVYPQEIIYRAFLFHRYRPLFPSDRAITWASAASFAFVHIVYGSAVSVLLSLAGGYLFANTYRRSGSLLLVSIQHALYGDLLFTIGLGHFFYQP